MSDKIIKCRVDYEENCDYKASMLEKDVEIPQQKVYIDVQKPQVVNINKRKGKNGNGQFYSTLTDTYYYGETLQVTTIIYREVIDQEGNIGHNNTPIKVGKVEFEYYDAMHPTADPIKITPSAIPIAENGLVTFKFVPHYDGYIRAYYTCEDDKDDGFYQNTRTGIIGGSPDRNITLTKIPVYVTPNTDDLFIKKKESINLTCNVTDIYENKLNYGYITFMGYHDLDPEALVDPREGMGVMLGNPVTVENGIAVLDYAPEQEIEIEYIHGSFNYNNDNYGRNFKYYYFHNNVIRVFYIREGDFLALSGGKLVDGQIQTICDFDGFIHANYGETIRTNVLFDDDDFTFYDDMNMIIHIDYTQYHLKETFTTRTIDDLDEYIKNNATFTTGTQNIKVTKNGTNNTHKYGTPYDVSNWMPGYYSIYVSFDDTEDKNNPERQYYGSTETRKIYFAIDYPNVSLSLDDISCNDDKFTVQAGANFKDYLKVKCNDTVPSGLTGRFIINGKEYAAILENNYFVIKSASLTIADIGNYSVSFVTDYYHDSTTNKIYLSQFSSMPTDNPVLKVRKTLEADVNIPKEYVDNEYPGSIKYQVYMNNYYDGEYEFRLALYKDETIIRYLDPVIYTGTTIERTIDDLEIGRYRIGLGWTDDDGQYKIAFSPEREITSAILDGYIAPPFDDDSEEIVTGFPATIPYIITSHKANLYPYDTTNLKIWFKHIDDEQYIGYPIETVNDSKNTVYIDYLKTFYKEGIYSTYISQNVDPDVMMVKPTNNNLNAVSITPHNFVAVTIAPVVTIEKNLPNKSFDVHVTTSSGEHNNQIILLEIQVSYGLGETAKVYVLTGQDGKITIPFEECDEALSSPNMQRQVYNIKVTINPYDDTLINTIKSQSNKEASQIIGTVRNHYSNLYATNEIIESFIEQIRYMDYCCLFSTYKKAIKSESYGS